MGDSSVTIDDILGELAEFAGSSERLPGDVDRWQIQDEYDENEKQAIVRMNKAVKSGKFESLQVYDPSRKHVVRVIRKVKNGL